MRDGSGGGEGGGWSKPSVFRMWPCPSELPYLALEVIGQVGQPYRETVRKSLGVGWGALFPWEQRVGCAVM